MRAAPAFQVTLRRFGVWRSAITLLAAAGIACVLAWAASRDAAVGGSAWAMLAGSVALMVVAVSCIAISLCRIPSTELRWDGLCWHLAMLEQISRPARTPANPLFDMRPGDLHSIIDLGPWMLLRFIAADERRTSTWLPAQKRGLEESWHAFRCAIYSPRPSPPDDALAEPVRASSAGRA